MLDHMQTADAMLLEANMGVLDRLKIVALAKRLRQTGRSAVSGCGFPRQLLRLRPAIPGGNQAVAQIMRAGAHRLRQSGGR